MEKQEKLAWKLEKENGGLKDKLAKIEKHLKEMNERDRERRGRERRNEAHRDFLNMDWGGF